VAAAVEAAGSNGPTVVIPNGIDVPIAETSPFRARPIDLFIAGMKQAELAKEVAAALVAPDRVIVTLTDRVPRDAFLAAMRRARVTLFLPHKEEGFYLPALEGMAAGTVVVCPDCVGNRSFCLPGINAFRPIYRLEDLVAATNAALSLSALAAAALTDSAGITVRQHSLEAERDAFLDVLHHVDELWQWAIACH
jgi:glycosyltransferase involved in cell wall biosynthesis